MFTYLKSVLIILIMTGVAIGVGLGDLWLWRLG
jgi:hypothetical protein